MHKKKRRHEQLIRKMQQRLRITRPPPALAVQHTTCRDQELGKHASDA